MNLILFQFSNSCSMFVRLKGFSKPCLCSVAAPDVTFVCSFGALITRVHKLELNWVNSTRVELQGRLKRKQKSDLDPFIFFSHDQHH